MTLTFDFITETEFRQGLQEDYAELLKCEGVSAWKAVHVLAGSIVEAVLVDYLVGAGHHKPGSLEDVAKRSCEREPEGWRAEAENERTL